MKSIQNILIVGYGFVGKAAHHIFTGSQGDAAFKINIIDPALNLQSDVDPASCEAIFICVPSPQAIDGHCNDSIVISVVEKYAGLNVPVIVRSTIPPSSIEKLLKIIPDIVYLPEFLREKNWEHDAINPPTVLIGTTSGQMSNRVHALLMSSRMNLKNANTVKRVHPVEASLFKYAANTFLAVKVVYMHELNRFMHESDYHMFWDSLKDTMQHDDRFGSSHFNAPGDHGYGYGGTCFPKDMNAFAKEGKGKLSLIESAITSNAHLQTTIPHVHK